MPVTVRLSKLVQDRFGEEIADELVRWFNLVDATYRRELRELNELNFARFDAKLDLRVAQLEARVDQRFAEQDAKWERRMGSLEVRVERGFANLMKWMFVFWAGNVATTIGIITVALKLAR